MAKGGFDPVVERVREATDIVELIGSYVALKKASSRWTGLCPFHQEKTPSFYVNPALQVFHCFGCGQGGDAFTFLMKHENMTFPEALRALAERAGIELPDRRGPPTDQLERIREALRVARSYFQAHLKSAGAAEARAYLERRGIQREVLERYGLGASPDAWDGLVNHARTLLSERVLIEAGLAAESSGGRVYDRFRNRIMIPIEAPGGGPVGFGGRALGDQEPKYLNSPETPVYRKGSILYGSGGARDGIRAGGRVIVVEGYFDVISLVQAGIEGVVGTCGTAMTPDQARLLRRVSERVILLLDGDTAGQRAALRALHVLVGEVPEVFVLSPPKGKDPDLWVREEGADAIRRRLEHPKPPLAFIQDLREQGLLREQDAWEQGVRLGARIQDPRLRDLWEADLASYFGIGNDAAHRAMVAAVRSAAGGGAPAVQPLRGAGQKARPGLSPLAREALRALLAHPSRAVEIAHALDEAGLLSEDFAETVQWLAGRAAEAGEAGEAGGRAALSQVLRERPQAAELLGFVANPETAAESPERILQLIRMQLLTKELEKLKTDLRRVAEERPEEARLLLLRQDELAKERARMEDEIRGRERD